MRHFTIAIIILLFGLIATAKPHCQGFNNYDDRVTIVFTDDDAGNQYEVSDVKLIPIWKGEGYPATSVKTTINDGVATVVLTFPHLTEFSNPKITLWINGKKTKFKVCH